MVAVYGGILHQRRTQRRKSIKQSRDRAGAAVPCCVVENKRLVVPQQDEFRRRRKVRQLFIHRDAAQCRTLPGDLLQGTLVGGIRGQPQVLADHQRIIFQRERAQIVTGTTTTATRKIGVVKLVIAHSDVDFRNAETAGA